jgi:hypothetical protein
MEEAINVLSGFKVVGMRDGKTQLYQALYLAIAALREQEERSKAESEGRVIVLPFLPGKAVWDYSEFFDGTPYAEYYKLQDSFIGVGVSANGKRTFEYDCFTIDPEQIGKTIFLTREEAEEALKRLEEV